MWSEEAITETMHKIRFGETVLQTQVEVVKISDCSVSRPRPVDVIFQDEITDDIFAPSNC